MNQYQVTYFYLGPELPGWAKEEDFGIVWASSEQEAKRKAAKAKHPIPILMKWMIPHLTARKIT